MDAHKNACLTPRGREAMVRALLECVPREHSEKAARQTMLIAARRRPSAKRLPCTRASTESASNQIGAEHRVRPEIEAGAKTGKLSV